MTDWEEIVRRYGPSAAQAAWRILGNVADVEDAVQQALMQVFELRKRQVVRHWSSLIRRTATCRALDILRRRKMTQDLEIEPLAISSDQPETNAICRELSQRLRQAVAELPEREATVFSLRYFADLSNQEIADELGITPGAAGAALHKARRKLQESLEEVKKS